MTVCLDSWAILAWLDGEEPAGSRVEDVVADRPVVSGINIFEVHDRLERDHGRAAADQNLSEMRAVTAPDRPGTARMIEAGRLNVSAAIALGDCFTIVSAAAHGVVLLTGTRRS